MNRKFFLFIVLFSSAIFTAFAAETVETASSAQSASPAVTFQAPAAMPSGMPPAMPPAGGGFSGAVVETMNSGGYTYVLIDTGTEKKWVAGPDTAVKVGDRVTVGEGAPMPGFHSKTLNRDFEMIYFVGNLAVGGAGNAPSGSASPGSPAVSAGSAPKTLPPGHPNISGQGSGSGVAEEPKITGIQKVEGGKTVGEIYAEKADLSGKEVKVRGKVVKFNGGIMGKNWLHIRDGSGEKETSDLTITTDGTVKVGDTVVVTGVLGIDKDFGYGYKYPVIIENAKVTVE